MSLSGTYDFNPTGGDITLIALSRLGIKRTEVLAEHMSNAYYESNLMQADWGADGITFFTVTPITQALTQGVSTYTVPLNVVSVLDVYINNGSQNRLIMPFSRTDYASLAEPSEQGFPTTFWWNRVIPSTITLWPVPDSNATYTMTYYVYNQIQDAKLSQGGNPAVPFFWLDAYVSDLSHRLSRHHAPALETVRKQDKIEAYARANKQVENEAVFISPGLSGYYR
jgi:hypothetical protein